MSDAIDAGQLRTCGESIAATGRFLYDRGWSPATSSNYSQRLDAGVIAITCSGRDKGTLRADDVMAVDLDGRPLTDGKPSAETLLHTRLYRRWDDLGAVLHTHSPACTVLSRHLADEDALVLSQYELLKAFAGITTHDTNLRIPIVANDQDIPRLADRVDALLDSHPDTRAYLIRGHGCYTWGRDMAECRRHLEALEFLLACELEHARLR